MDHSAYRGPGCSRVLKHLGHSIQNSQVYTEDRWTVIPQERTGLLLTRTSTQPWAHCGCGEENLACLYHAFLYLWLPPLLGHKLSELPEASLCGSHVISSSQ